MKRLKLKAKVMLLLFAALAMSVSVLAEQLPEGVFQVWTSVEGNLTYYVKQGDQVKKGAPLFYVGTADNNVAIFFQILHKIDFSRLIYLRRHKLVKTHSVSQEEFDNAWNSLILAEDELASYICKVKQGFYVAPFDCEVVKLLYLNGSGIGDGNPAINIKCTDKDYKFEPTKPDPKMMEVITQSNELIKAQAEKLDVNKVMKYLKDEIE